MSTLRLPKLDDGYQWFALFAELVPADGSCAFFEAGDAGGFLMACLPAKDEDQARAFFISDANDSGADVLAIKDVRVVSSVLGLPRDENGALDPAIAEAFADPDLGAALVHGVLYAYPEEA